MASEGRSAQNAQASDTIHLTGSAFSWPNNLPGEAEAIRVWTLCFAYRRLEKLVNRITEDCTRLSDTMQFLEDAEKSLVLLGNRVEYALVDDLASVRERTRSSLLDAAEFNGNQSSARSDTRHELQVAGKDLRAVLQSGMHLWGLSVSASVSDSAGKFRRHFPGH